MESTKKSSHMKFGILVWALIVLCSLYVCIRVYYPYYPDIRIYGRADNGCVLCNHIKENDSKTIGVPEKMIQLSLYTYAHNPTDSYMYVRI